jgi:hypothetical protein
MKYDIDSCIFGSNFNHIFTLNAFSYILKGINFFNITRKSRKKIF